MGARSSSKFSLKLIITQADIGSEIKVYIDGSCEFLTRWSIGNFLSNVFRNEDIPGSIRTSNIGLRKNGAQPRMEYHALVLRLFKK